MMPSWLKHVLFLFLVSKRPVSQDALLVQHLLFCCIHHPGMFPRFAVIYCMFFFFCHWFFSDASGKLLLIICSNVQSPSLVASNFSLSDSNFSCAFSSDLCVWVGGSMCLCVFVCVMPYVFKRNLQAWGWPLITVSWEITTSLAFLTQTHRVSHNSYCCCMWYSA